MSKNIVLCLDGTGNQVKASRNTNVVRLYQLLDLSEPERQVAFYDPGVGTFSASGAWTPISRWFTKVLGLGLGYGIKTNLAEAYVYLMRTYVPGDRVFVFGFSRGAFTARGLTGMSYRAGLFRTGAENLVSYVVSHFTKGNRWSKQDWGKVDRFASAFSVDTDGSLALPIHFLGLWDSVKALGYLRWDPKWPYTRKLLNAVHVRHAVSINERRRPYAEYLVENTEKVDLQEVWFAGVHSDVGGTFEDDDRLSTIALKWMVDRGLEEGLLLKPGAYRRQIKVTRGDAIDARLHKMGKVWALLTYRNRPLDALNGSTIRIHQSVKDRVDGRPDFELGATSKPIEWVDESWIQAHALAP